MDKIDNIIWTDDGIDSFEEIIKYISIESKHYARLFADKILFSIEKLKDYPLIDRVVPEYND